MFTEIFGAMSNPKFEPRRTTERKEFPLREEFFEQHVSDKLILNSDRAARENLDRFFCQQD